LQKRVFESTFDSSSDCKLAANILNVIATEQHSTNTPRLIQRLFSLLKCRTAEDELAPKELFPDTTSKRKHKEQCKSYKYEQDVHNKIKDALHAFEEFTKRKQETKPVKKSDEVWKQEGYTESQIVPFHLLNKDRQHSDFLIKLEECRKPSPASKSPASKGKRAKWNIPAVHATELCATFDTTELLN
jgi:hypothetical protein